MAQTLSDRPGFATNAPSRHRGPGRLHPKSIVSLVEEGDPNAVRLSVAEADAYLASFDDVRGTSSRRDELVAALRRELPRTPQADQILEAIDKGSGEDVA